MARGIQHYPRITPPDSDFPDGRLKDRDGSDRGTPINEFTNGDLQQFFAKIMRIAGIAPNLLPDCEYTGFQYYQALSSILNSRIGTPVIRGLLGSYTPNDVIILYGFDIVVVTNTATWTAGAVFYNNKIYIVPAGAHTKPGGSFTYYISSEELATIGMSDSGVTAGIATYGASTVKNKSYTFTSGAGGDYIAIDNRTVMVNLTYTSGNKTAGQTLYTIDVKFRTSVARTVGISFVTYQSGAGAAQQGHCIPALLNTNTGVVSAVMDMTTNHDTVVGGFSYLLD